MHGWRAAGHGTCAIAPLTVLCDTVVQEKLRPELRDEEAALWLTQVGGGSGWQVVAGGTQPWCLHARMATLTWQRFHTPTHTAGAERQCHRSHAASDGEGAPVGSDLLAVAAALMCALPCQPAPSRLSRPAFGGNNLPGSPAARAPAM